MMSGKMVIPFRTFSIHSGKTRIYRKAKSVDNGVIQTSKGEGIIEKER